MNKKKYVLQHKIEDRVRKRKEKDTLLYIYARERRERKEEENGEDEVNGGDGFNGKDGAEGRVFSGQGKSFSPTGEEEFAGRGEKKRSKDFFGRSLASLFQDSLSSVPTDSLYILTTSSMGILREWSCLKNSGSSTFIKTDLRREKIFFLALGHTK